MSYTKTTWATGDVVTSAKLNNIENGIANATLSLTVDAETYALNKTWQEIHDALESGITCFTVLTEGNALFLSPVVYVGGKSPTYIVAVVRTDNGTSQEITFSTSTASGYPVMANG